MSWLGLNPEVLGIDRQALIEARPGIGYTKGYISSGWQAWPVQPLQFNLNPSYGSGRGITTSANLLGLGWLGQPDDATDPPPRVRAEWTKKIGTVLQASLAVANALRTNPDQSVYRAQAAGLKQAIERLREGVLKLTMWTHHTTGWPGCGITVMDCPPFEKRQTLIDWLNNAQLALAGVAPGAVREDKKPMVAPGIITPRGTWAADPSKVFRDTFKEEAAKDLADAAKRARDSLPTVGLGLGGLALAALAIYAFASGMGRGVASRRKG